jgi:hypothetical protein
MTTDHIVDFPHQRSCRAVQFTDTIQVLIVKRHEDPLHELWYTAAEYDLMKLALKEDVLNIRALTSKDAAFAYMEIMPSKPKTTAAFGSVLLICSHQPVSTR